MTEQNFELLVVTKEHRPGIGVESPKRADVRIVGGLETDSPMAERLARTGRHPKALMTSLTKK